MLKIAYGHQIDMDTLKANLNASGELDYFIGAITLDLIGRMGEDLSECLIEDVIDDGYSIFDYCEWTAELEAVDGGVFIHVHISDMREWLECDL